MGGTNNKVATMAVIKGKKYDKEASEVEVNADLGISSVKAENYSPVACNLQPKLESSASCGARQ